MAWRYLLFDLNTMAPVAELPAHERSFGDQYNDAGQFSCTIPLDVDLPGVTLDTLQPPDAVWAAELDGTLLWAGPVWGLEPDFAAGRLTLSGAGWLSLLDRRRFPIDVTYSNLDQHFIARNLINVAQAVEFQSSHLGIDTTLVTASGVLRTRTYEGASELPVTSELLRQLAAVDLGFYFRFEPRWTAGPNSLLTVKFLCQYPASGRLTDVVLDVGRTCDIMSATLDGSAITNYVYAVGSGEGPTKARAVVGNLDHLAAHRMLQTDIQLQNVSSFATLQAHGRERLRQGAAPAFIPKVRVGVDALGGFLVGDKVVFRLDRGVFQVDDLYRIVAYTCPDEDWVDLDLAPAVLFEGGDLT